MEDPEKATQQKKNFDRQDAYFGVIWLTIVIAMFLIHDALPGREVLIRDAHAQVCVAMINTTQISINNLAPDLRLLLKNLIECRELRALL